MRLRWDAQQGGQRGGHDEQPSDSHKETFRSISRRTTVACLSSNSRWRERKAPTARTRSIGGVSADSFMGANFTGYLQEAHRTLKLHGWCYIIEGAEPLRSQRLQGFAKIQSVTLIVVD